MKTSLRDLSTDGFVNYQGEPWRPVFGAKPARKSESPDKFHKGFRVMGLPPGSLEKAKEKREAEIAAAQSDKKLKMPQPWDEIFWIANAKQKAVRSKPYELKDAANLCAEIARKDGWLRVTIEEIQRGEA